MRIAGHCALGFGPPHDRRGPGGPPFDFGAVGTRIGLLFQVEQANVSQRLRTKTADFQIILHHAERSAQLVDGGREKTSLIIEARPPRQHASDVKSFTVHLHKHVLRSHSLGRIRVVRATGPVNVMVAAVKTVGHRIDPAFQLHRDLRGRARWNGNLAPKAPIFRAAVIVHCEATGRQQNHAAVAPVNLRLKIKIRREPFCLRRKHVSGLVAKNETRRSGLRVVVQNAQLDLDGGSNFKQDGRFAAKAKVLISLADLEPDRGFACSRFAAVDEGDRVFGSETAQVRRHRRVRIHLRLQESPRHRIGLRRLLEMGALHALRAQWRHAGIDLSRLRTDDAQFPGESALIDHFHEHGCKPGLLQPGFRGAALNLHAGFGIDCDNQKDLRIEQFLKTIRILCFGGSFEFLDPITWQRRSEEVERL